MACPDQRGLRRAQAEAVRAVRPERVRVFMEARWDSQICLPAARRPLEKCEGLIFWEGHRG